tara:strand:+ start:52 stop:3966 length:3915 start_codon:yes stop_codon:yes gene_type:complete
MPYITFSDGFSRYIEDKNPETIKRAQAEHEAELKLLNKGEPSVLGDVGRQAVRGVQDIGRGLSTTVTSAYDSYYDADLTKDVNEYFDKISPGEAKTTAGNITKYLVQFGIPGFGVAGVLAKTGKIGKIGQALGGGIVDGAVATDDIITLKDVFIDKQSESDEARLARLNGAEAAHERLKKKLNVAAEGAGFILGIPLAFKATKGAIYGATDLLAPLGSVIAKGAVGTTRALKPGELQRTAFDANQSVLKKWFTFAGDRPDEFVAQTMAAKTSQVKAMQDQVDTAFDQIIKTTQRSVNTGTMNQTNALALSRSIEDYMFPRIRIDYQSPNLSRTKKIQDAKRIQREAEQNILDLEKQFINYKGLGLGEGLKISTLLKNNRELFDTYSNQILNYSDETADGFMHLFVPQELRAIIAENAGLYGTRAYRAILDKGFKVQPKFQDKAVKEIQNTFGVDETTARRAFFELRNPGPKNKVGLEFETKDMLMEGLQREKSILKGRQLDNLPQVRRALGETAGYLQTDWRTALANTKLTANITSQKLSGLIGKAEMFKQIKQLDELAPKTGGVKFLRSKEFGMDADGKFAKELTDYDAQGNAIVFKQFDEDAGALAGSYARADVFDALMGAKADMISQTSIWGRMYTSMLAVKAGSQYGKTVLSPGAQIRNFTSIPFFSLLNGNLGSTGRFVDAVQTSFSGLLNPKTRVLRKDKIREFMEEGIIQKGGARLGETLEIAKLAAERSGFVSKVGRAADKSGMRFFEKTYGMTDDAGRVFNYLSEKDRMIKALVNEPGSVVPIESAKNMTRFADLIEGSRGGAVIKPQDIIDRYGQEALEQFARSEAGEITLNTVQNYQRIVPFAGKLVRQSPLGNFVAFPAEIIRNTSNALSRGIKELASSNTELQKIGMRRVTGAVTTASLTGTALTSLGMALTGVTKEKIEAYKRNGAPWDRTGTLIPIASDRHGNPTQMFNFSYMNPYDYIKRPINRVFQEIASGNRDEESLLKILNDSSWGAIAELGQSFAEPAFALQAVFDAREGQTLTGKRIWNEGDSDGLRFAKGFLHFVDTAIPTISPYRIHTDPFDKRIVGIAPPGLTPKNFTRAVFGSTNKKGDDQKILDRYGKEIDVAETMVQAFTGFKVVKPQIQRTLKYRGWEATRAIRDTTNEFNRLLRIHEPKTAEQFLQAYINENEDRYRVLRDLYTSIEDSRILGLTEREIEKELKNANVANYQDVMKGIFRPIEVDRDLVTQSRIGKIGVPQPIYKGMFDMARKGLTQDLTGKFLTPDIRAKERAAKERAREALRAEEERKLYGTP